MKLFVAVFAAILVSCHALAHGGNQMDDLNLVTTFVEGNLVNAIEKFRVTMKTGDPKKNIPVLDPFKSIQERVNILKKDLVQLDALLTNIQVDGLSEFKIHKAEFKLIGVKLMLRLTWSKINLKTNYVADGLIGGNIPVFGNGMIKATVKDLDFSVELSVSALKGLYIKQVKSAVALNDLDLKITGLFDDDELSELMSAAISNMTPQVIKDYQSYVTGLVNAEITKFGNEFLKGKSLKDLLDLLK